MIHSTDGDTMIQEAQTLTLASNWLDANSSVTVPLALEPEPVNTIYTDSSNTVWYYTTWPASTPRTIRLKMSEVEKLRAAAKKDKALREVLEKFGPHIEVEVDFG